MRSWMLPARATEATTQQLVATGAAGTFGVDPVDGDRGYTPLGANPRGLPAWTRARAAAYSIAAYRSNPVARAIIDTYTSFCVGDSGLSLQATNPDVRVVVEEFWNDPRNALAEQTLPLRQHLLAGETVNEMLTGARSGVVRRSVIDPERIRDVTLLRGNPLWHDKLLLDQPGSEPLELKIISVDDFTGLRSGDVFFWPSWRTTELDRRGEPFLMPVIDWLDSYDQVLSNLIDRTALARHIAFDVTVKGPNPNAVKDYIAQRGGTGIPRSGTIEVHNDSIEWKPLEASTGAPEDTQTSRAIFTNVAAGTGLAKTWLAEPEDSNRATSLTMAEPVRRRVGGVQNLWLATRNDLVRYQVDQAVLAGRLPAEVMVRDETGTERPIRAADAVKVTGPTVAAADASMTAEMLANLASGLDSMIRAGLLSVEAGQVASQKAWEQFCGIPWRPDLASPDANQDLVAEHVDDNAAAVRNAPAAQLTAV
jgi:hypothetical protein